MSRLLYNCQLNLTSVYLTSKYEPGKVGAREEGNQAPTCNPGLSVGAPHFSCDVALSGTYSNTKHTKSLHQAMFRALLATWELLHCFGVSSQTSVCVCVCVPPSPPSTPTTTTTTCFSFRPGRLTAVWEEDWCTLTHTHARTHTHSAFFII